MIKPEARICRFCRFTLTDAQPPTDPARPTIGKSIVPPPDTSTPRADLSGKATTRIVGGAATTIALLALLVWRFLPPTTPNGVAATTSTTAAPTAVPPAQEPRYPPLAPGETLTWQADTAGSVIDRQVGPLALRISKSGTGDRIAPRLEISHPTGAVTMEGERVAPSFEHRITSFVNRVGAPPAVMLQSFSGGAHCCNRIQLGGLSGGALKVVDLGRWDSEAIEPPSDRSGDGVADFVFVDQAFLYAFAPYAISRSVPKIVNVVGGRVVDVSTRPAFRRLFVEAAREHGAFCRDDPDGQTRNAACAAYLAAAARTGRLGLAWAEMLVSYDATVDWVLPTGCTITAGEGGCPENRQVQYQSYPEALLAFLKRHRYVKQAWQPPAASAPLDTPEDGPDFKNEPKM